MRLFPGLQPTWENQLKEAEKLPDSDLERHASVSTKNRHRCQDCFCCAALTVLECRREEGKKGKKG